MAFADFLSVPTTGNEAAGISTGAASTGTFGWNDLMHLVSQGQEATSLDQGSAPFKPLQLQQPLANKNPNAPFQPLPVAQTAFADTDKMDSRDSQDLQEAMQILQIAMAVFGV